MQHVTFLASDELEGAGQRFLPSSNVQRSSLLPGFATTGRTPVAERLPTSRSFVQSRGTIEMGTKNALHVNGIPRQEGSDFATKAFSSSGSYEGPVVFAGYGITASKRWLGRLSGARGEGKGRRSSCVTARVRATRTVDSATPHPRLKRS